MAQVMYKIIQVMDFMKVKPSGKVDLEESKRILGDMAEIGNMPGEFDILLDVRETFGDLDHNDLWVLVEELGQRRKTFRNKIAVLTRNDEQFNKAAFAEMCSNTSVHNFKLSAFTDFEKATEWLQDADGLGELWL
jgi:hypothetical protein